MGRRGEGRELRGRGQQLEQRGLRGRRGAHAHRGGRRERDQRQRAAAESVRAVHMQRTEGRGEVVTQEERRGREASCDGVGNNKNFNRSKLSTHCPVILSQ